MASSGALAARRERLRLSSTEGSTPEQQDEASTEGVAAERGEDDEASMEGVWLPSAVRMTAPG
jgi:hypothetical protein